MRRSILLAATVVLVAAAPLAAACPLSPPGPGFFLKFRNGCPGFPCPTGTAITLELIPAGNNMPVDVYPPFGKPAASKASGVRVTPRTRLPGRSLVVKVSVASTSVLRGKAFDAGEVDGAARVPLLAGEERGQGEE